MNLLQHAICISFGAMLGALNRWGLGLLLNPLFSSLSFGTLIANYLGCFLAGIILAIGWQYPQFSPEWRALLMTGYLGSLTTFSAFSAEVIENIEQHQWLEGMGIASLHLFGGLFFTALGVFIWRAWQ
ncbi:fluoride efflux transporter CrcB [Pasteurella sp. PK-2025]|uniref:fluoride efflux transporter CrcB n=1 Tax=Pasteurella sp. PK-2025 TaxID=3413133 RepID=UPI003C767898